MVGPRRRNFDTFYQQNVLFIPHVIYFVFTQQQRFIVYAITNNSPFSYLNSDATVSLSEHKMDSRLSVGKHGRMIVLTLRCLKQVCRIFQPVLHSMVHLTSATNRKIVVAVLVVIEPNPKDGK